MLAYEGSIVDGEENEIWSQSAGVQSPDPSPDMYVTLHKIPHVSIAVVA